MPDADPWRAWSNFTFTAHAGHVREVDLLVVAPGGVCMIELKDWHGSVTTENGTWVQTTPGGRRVPHGNPLHLVNKKAKELAGLLGQNGSRVWVGAAVCFTDSSLRVRLPAHDQNGVYTIDDLVAMLRQLPRDERRRITGPDSDAAGSAPDVVQARRPRRSVQERLRNDPKVFPEIAIAGCFRGRVVCHYRCMIPQQFARPRGMLGRMTGMVMARSNAALTRRVTAALDLRGDETVLEIGPGPGVGLMMLAQALSAGRVCGAEPSPVMRAQAAARVRRFADRVELADATADALGWPPATFDAVCAINNVQLWQPLPASLARVFDVLVPGGTLALGVSERAVLPQGGRAGRSFDTILLPHLRQAGFTDVRSAWAPGGNRHELLVLARRPLPHAPT